ncbi:MAG: VacJ family lipoprotein [Pseudomonadota bacterium]
MSSSIAGFPALRRFAACLLLLGGLSACADPQGATLDPNEQINRGAHDFNVGLDRNIVRPASQIYGNNVDPALRTMFSNFASNFDEPKRVINDILQGKAGDALNNTGRFVINSTIGLLGFFDPATDFGLAERPTDFGETLFVWGVNEGVYVEAPFLGPSTTRHAWGRVVDIALNPLNIFAPSPTGEVSLGASVFGGLNARYEFTSAIDGVFYDSADSYVTARSLYLQQRRFELAGEDGVEIIDPFEELGLE